jgi:hypothetical protein
VYELVAPVSDDVPAVNDVAPLVREVVVVDHADKSAIGKLDVLYVKLIPSAV